MKTRLVTMLCSTLVVLAVLSSPALAQQKTVKACEDEWRAHKADNQAKGITEKAYVAECRTRSASAPASPNTAAPTARVPTTTAPATPTATPAAPPAAPTATAPPPATKPAPVAVTTPTGANQFSTEVLAKARCPADTIVWVNLSSGIYHFAGTKDYGKTKSGAYMCEKDTAAAKFRAAKNEKRPS